MYSLVCCAGVLRCRSSALGVFVGLLLSAYLLNALLRLHLFKAHGRLGLRVHTVELQVLLPAFVSSRERCLVLELRLVVGVVLRSCER